MQHLTVHAVPKTLPAPLWHRPPAPCANTSHLIGIHQPGVREVERGDEEPHALALHPVPIQVVCDHSGHEVLARPRPAVEGQGQWLVGLWVVDKTLDGFQDHRLSQVLPVELRLEVPRQTCPVQKKCLEMNHMPRINPTSTMYDCFLTIKHQFLKLHYTDI